MKCLVTGGAGFIGSNISRGLLKKGFEVRILDNFSTGRRENLTGIANDIDLIEGDIKDIDTVMRAVKGVDYVFHKAAVPSVKQSVEQPLLSNESNINGTLNVLWAALKNNVKRVIYASSSAIYGDIPVLPKHEGLPPNPQSPYALTKYAGEVYCRLFSEVYNLETVSLRYFNIFGPCQDPDSEYSAVIPKFVNRMVRNERPVIYGDGKQTRDFCYVDNVVQANLLAMDCERADGYGINVGCGERISLLKLIDMLNDILGTKITPQFAPAREGDVKHSLADLQMAKEILGYTPTVKVREGLKRLINSTT